MGLIGLHVYYPGLLELSHRHTAHELGPVQLLLRIHHISYFYFGMKGVEVWGLNLAFHHMLNICFAELLNQEGLVHFPLLGFILFSLAGLALPAEYLQVSYVN